jgi:hypothetical protein
MPTLWVLLKADASAILEETDPLDKLTTPLQV